MAQTSAGLRRWHRSSGHGLALRGYEVVATDLSIGTVERTRELAHQRRVEGHAEVIKWDDLGYLDLGLFVAVFCVGNSLAHAERRSTPSAFSTVLDAVAAAGGWVARTHHQ